MPGLFTGEQCTSSVTVTINRMEAITSSQRFHTSLALSVLWGRYLIPLVLQQKSP